MRRDSRACAPGAGRPHVLLATLSALAAFAASEARALQPGNTVPRPAFSEQVRPPRRVADLPDQEATWEERAEGRLFGPLLHRDIGVSCEPIYYGELLSNTRGGISTRNATQYEGLLDIPLYVDFRKAGLPVPGRFFLLTQNSHGRGLTEGFVGDAQVVSNIDSFDNIMQVSEYWYEVRLFRDNVTVRLGKQDVNNEFLTVDMADDFLQSSFGISPTQAIPTYPHPSAAAVFLVQLTEALEAKVGVFDGVPDGGTWGFSGTGSVFMVGELEYHYALCHGRLPGVVDVGLAYLTPGRFSPGELSGTAWGFYFDFEQLLFRENPDDEGDDQGMGVFVQYSESFEREAVDFPTYFGGGIVFKGTIDGRDDDMMGAGIAHSRLSFGGTGQETAVEVFYEAVLAPWISVQADLQYVASPSGLYRDALVAGVRFEIAL